MDLTKQHPRSPYQQVGGYVMLGRTIDKARAKLVSALGAYIYNSPMDGILFGFLEIDADDFLAVVKKSSADDEIVEWVKVNQARCSEAEIQQFNDMISSIGPKEYDEGRIPYLKPEDYEFEGLRGTLAPKRPDLSSWPELYEAARQKLAPDRPNLCSWFDLIEADEGRLKEKY